MESEEHSGGEEDNDENYLSSNQLLAEVDVRIEYCDGRTFNTLEEDEIENEEMNNDSCDESTDFTMQQTKLPVEKNNKSTLNPSKIDNDKVMDNNKKQYLSNEKPQIFYFNWWNGDLKSKEQSNMPKLQEMDELGTSLRLSEPYFYDALVTQIVKFTKLYGQREKGDCTISFDKSKFHRFDLSNEKFRLFLGIWLIINYHKLPHRRMYWETTLDTFV